MIDIKANKNKKFTESPVPENKIVEDIVEDRERPLSEGDDKKSSGLPVETSGKESVQKETGGPAGPEPTRYGDWEVNGRCSDF